MGLESGSFVYMAIETKEESIETSSSIIMVPITEPPKKTSNDVEMGKKEEEEEKKNLKAKLNNKSALCSEVEGRRSI